MADSYKDRFHVYTSAEKSFDESNIYFDENSDGTVDYSTGKRDFNIQEFLSNLVLRWEYNPGSSVYLVWSQTRNYSNNTGVMDYFDNIGDLFNRDNNIPHNVFLVKFSYRFGLR